MPQLFVPSAGLQLQNQYVQNQTPDISIPNSGNPAKALDPAVKLAEKFEQFQMQVQETEDNAVAQDRLNQLNEEVSKAQTDLQNSDGENEQKLYSSHEENVKNAVEKYGAGLTGNAKLKYQQQASAVQHQANAQGYAIHSVKAKEWDNEVRKTSINNSIQDALSFYGTPEFELKLQDGEQQVVDALVANGKGGDQKIVEEAKRGYRSDVYKAVINYEIDSDRVGSAGDILAKHKGQMDQYDVLALQAKLFQKNKQLAKEAMAEKAQKDAQQLDLLIKQYAMASKIPTAEAKEMQTAIAERIGQLNPAMARLYAMDAENAQFELVSKNNGYDDLTKNNLAQGMLSRTLDGTDGTNGVVATYMKMEGLDYKDQKLYAKTRQQYIEAHPQLITEVNRSIEDISAQHYAEVSFKGNRDFQAMNLATASYEAQWNVGAEQQSALRLNANKFSALDQKTQQAIKNTYDDDTEGFNAFVQKFNNRYSKDIVGNDERYKDYMRVVNNGGFDNSSENEIRARLDREFGNLSNSQINTILSTFKDRQAIAHGNAVKAGAVANQGQIALALYGKKKFNDLEPNEQDVVSSSLNILNLEVTKRMAQAQLDDPKHKINMADPTTINMYTQEVLADADFIERLKVNKDMLEKAGDTVLGKNALKKAVNQYERQSDGTYSTKEQQEEKRQQLKAEQEKQKAERKRQKQLQQQKQNTPNLSNYPNTFGDFDQDFDNILFMRDEQD